MQNLSGIIQPITDGFKALSNSFKSKKTLYYNARITTEGAAATTNPQYLASFSVPVPLPFIQNGIDWNLSIIRATVSLHGLPALFVAHPVQAGPNPTNTSYTFTLKYQDASVSQTVQWNPADSSLRQNAGNYNDNYWYEYSFIRMGTFINAALQAAMTALIVAKPALAGVPAPFFQYDNDKCQFVLYTPVELLDSAATPIQIFQNEPCHFLLGGLPVEPTGVLGQDERVIIVQQPAEPAVTISGHQFVTRAQLPGALTNWTPVRRLVVTTQSLDIISENTVAVTAYGATSFGGSTNPNTQQRIISDYTPNMTRGDELLNGTFEYEPTAQYRLTSLTSNGPVTAIDLQIWYEDPLGGLHPYYLRYGGHAAFKMAFIEK